MTTYYASPIGRYEANAHPDDPTLRRPVADFAHQTVPVTLDVGSSKPSKSGWIVSGLAAVLATAALAAVGSLAFHEFAASDSAVDATSTPSPAPIASVAIDPVPPAAVPVPAVTAAPTVSAHKRPNLHRVVVTVPTAPIVPPSPVMTPSNPMEPPTPIPVPAPSSGGIKTCDLVACDPLPPTSGSIPRCGDFRACGPADPVQPTRPRD